MDSKESSAQELTRMATPFPNRARPVNAKQFAQKIFTANRIYPRPDSELSDLIAEASKVFLDPELSRFLEVQKKFDGPVTMMETGKKIEHYKLRECLKELPRYTTAAETAGLKYEQAVDVLMHTLGSDRFDFSHVDIYIMQLARIYKIAVQSGVNLGQHVDALKDIITFGAKSWGPEMSPSLYMLSIALRLGLSVEQAYTIFKKIEEVGAPATGYVTPHFNDALKSMLPAKVDPALVAEAFELIGDNDGYYAGLYGLFKAIMAFVGPTRGMTPNEVLAFFITRVKNGKGVPMLEAGENGEQEQEKKEVPKEKYFIENENDVLEHTALPCRKVKPLNAGMRDLEKLATARGRRWEEVGEGMWTFDPESQSWYSFGGQVETPSMGEVMAGRAERVRHNFLTYDLSKLSKNPYLFHVHPEDYEAFIAPPRESMVYPELRDDFTKFLTATPSGADYGSIGELLKGSEEQVPTRSFIAHALGITEFSYPNDVAKLEEMKAQSRNIRDQVLLDFDVKGYIQKNGWPVDRLHLIQSMIEALNKKLPEGFRLRLYPTGTDFENAQAVTDLQRGTRRNVKKHLAK